MAAGIKIQVPDSIAGALDGSTFGGREDEEVSVLLCLAGAEIGREVSAICSIEGTPTDRLRDAGELTKLATRLSVIASSYAQAVEQDRAMEAAARERRGTGDPSEGGGD